MENVEQERSTDVKATELLHEHDEAGSLSGTAHPGDSPHVAEHVRALKRLLFQFFQLKKLGKIKEIPARLEVAEAEPAHRFIRIRHPALGHVPPW